MRSLRLSGVTTGYKLRLITAVAVDANGFGIFFEG